MLSQALRHMRAPGFDPRRQEINVLPSEIALCTQPDICARKMLEDADCVADIHRRACRVRDDKNTTLPGHRISVGNIDREETVHVSVDALIDDEFPQVRAFRRTTLPSL